MTPILRLPGTFFDGYVTTVEWATAIVAIVILISSLDDLAIDIVYWGRTLYRALFVHTRHSPLEPEALVKRDEQPLAVIIPAWKEADVIAPMLESFVETIDYHDYTIFVGTYPNDPETVAEVERLRRRFRRLVRVDVGAPGPTCKADCLNAVVQSVVAFEAERGVRFSGVVLHDSEDVVHPLELRFFNYLLPRKDMVQIPVMPLERRWDRWVGNTYLDEFAEAHGRDLVVREALTGSVPSAGVGTCFSRRALDVLMEARSGRPFNTDTLTEDYDIAARLNQAGLNSIIARFMVDTDMRRAPIISGEGRIVRAHVPLSVREFFPDSFTQASRQRGRWIIGIGLQSWRQLGWEGSFGDRYFLLRDRKGVLTALVLAPAYLLGLLISILIIMETWGFSGPLHLFSALPFMTAVFAMNLMLLLVRALQRAYFVSRLYGPGQAALSVPRLVVSNFVNFVAAIRAWRAYLGHLATGDPIAWDKTDHDFPSLERRTEEPRRLGELLMAWGALDRPTLDTALEENSHTRRPLGAILVAHGWLDEETLAEAIAYQAGLERGHISRKIVAEQAHLLPVQLSVRARAVATGVFNGRPVLAVSAPLDPAIVTSLTETLGVEPVQTVVRDSELAAALRLLRGEDEHAAARVPLLGDLLAAGMGVERARFERALADYTTADGRIGEHLVRKGVVTPAALATALAEQRRIREDAQ